ncbi:hypothetical protein [Streptomyces triculaminicus]|uniref:hypothetical protein n=1 Tax=Streptomyces triculaminicus TaxID=2816232 RepID=UPI0037CCF53F
MTVMPLTTVTLPDGTAATVHTEGSTWTLVSRCGPGGRNELIKSVLHCVDVEGMLLGCAALRRASKMAANIVVEEDTPHDMLSAHMRVLCTKPECRALAEHDEKVGEPFWDAPAARTWALTQTIPKATTEVSR